MHADHARTPLCRVACTRMLLHGMLWPSCMQPNSKCAAEQGCARKPCQPLCAQNPAVLLIGRVARRTYLVHAAGACTESYPPRRMPALPNTRAMPLHDDLEAKYERMAVEQRRRARRWADASAAWDPALDYCQLLHGKTSLKCMAVV